MSSTATTARRFANYVNGQDRDGLDGATFESINPTTGAAFGQFVESSAKDVDAAVRAAHAAFEGPWRNLSPTRRGRLMMRWGDLIAENAEQIAALETAQNGKLLAEMRTQARVVQDWLYYFGGLAHKIGARGVALRTQARVVQDWLYYFGGLADKIERRVVPRDRTSVLNYTVQEPLGVVAASVRWNSPTFLTIMTVGPALAAGNTIVIKPSEVTSASAFELARLAEQAGIPPGVINVVTGARAAGEALVSHPLVAKISFTGSDAAGREIAARAGQRLIGCTLELGGKSPNIVFDDADIEQVEAGVLAGIFAAAGQTCVAGSRAFFQKGIYDRLTARLVDRAKNIRLGDPLKAETQMGPVATAAQLAKDEKMVARAVEDGAKVLAGGARRKVEGLEGGYFYAPTILEGAKDDAFIMQNEVFGPVLCVTPFETEEDVLKLANGTQFGLA